MKLFEILAKLNTKEEVEAFFDDLCTYAEIEKMEQRVEAAQMFLDGATYNQVIQKTEISSATLSRVSRCIRYGSGGYSNTLRRLIAEERASQELEETTAQETEEPQANEE
jgi:TrpR-related protein YerC/YecD